MAESNKRKKAPVGENRPSKRNKWGRFKKGNQKSDKGPKVQGINLSRGFIEAGDVGIWVTCARGQEGKAAREVIELFDDHIERLYGIKSNGGCDSDNDEEDGGDIEASIKRELESIKKQEKQPTKIYSLVRLGQDCIFFVKTKDPIQPVAFCKHICKSIQPIASNPTQWRSRYINRLIPVTLIGKATEEGVDEVGRKVLSGHFTVHTTNGERSEASEDSSKNEAPLCSYAIRLSFRNHNTLKRDALIKQIAALVGPGHTVNLSAPDKVIIVDVHEAFIGMSVVDGDWEQLRRYNLNELFHQTNKSNSNKLKTPHQAQDEKGEEGQQQEEAKPTDESG